MAMMLWVSGSYSNVNGSGPANRLASRTDGNGDPAGSVAIGEVGGHLQISGAVGVSGPTRDSCSPQSTIRGRHRW